MHYIPLIWFIVVFLFILKKRGLCASSYVTFLYVITSLFAVFVKNLQLMPESYLSPDFFVVLVYCVLLSLSIIPIYRFDSIDLKTIIVPKAPIIKILTIFYFFVFLFTSIVYREDLLFRLTYGDWVELRNLYMSGNGYDTAGLTGLMRYLQMFIGVIGNASYLMFPFFFINYCFLKKSLLYSSMALIGTTNVVLVGILYIDRSSTFGWITMFGLSVALFWKYLSAKQKKRIIPALVIPAVVVLVYFVSVSIGRFTNSSLGADNQTIRYIGQPFYNFCYIFENFNNHMIITTRQLFPFVHQYIIGDYEGVVANQQAMTGISGIECGVFYTFLGAFILDSNQIGPFLFITLYLILANYIVKRCKSGRVTLSNYCMAFIFMLIPAYGCIAYYFTIGFITLSTVLTLLLIRFFENTSRKKELYIN